MSEPVTSTTADSLLKSILDGPLLVGDLPESKCFCRSNLKLPEVLPDLNLQQKLGHLFEDALASLLVASHKVDLLEQNLQLRDEDRTTVGELDFLIREHSNNALVHLELATKFYLAVETPSGITLPGQMRETTTSEKLLACAITNFDYQSNLAPACLRNTKTLLSRRSKWYLVACLTILMRRKRSLRNLFSKTAGEVNGFISQIATSTFPQVAISRSFQRRYGQFHSSFSKILNLNRGTTASQLNGG